jgi:hypothetical protein
MRIQVLVQIDISFSDGSPDALSETSVGRQMRASAVEAIRRELQTGSDNGFSHAMEESTGIEIISVEDQK